MKKQIALVCSNSLVIHLKVDSSYVLFKLRVFFSFLRLEAVVVFC